MSEKKKIKKTFCLLGPSGAGKTTLLQTFMNREFTPSARPTLEFNQRTLCIEKGETDVFLNFYDTVSKGNLTDEEKKLYEGVDFNIIIFRRGIENDAEFWLDLCNDPEKTFIIFNRVSEDTKKETIIEEEKEHLKSWIEEKTQKYKNKIIEDLEQELKNFCLKNIFVAGENDQIINEQKGSENIHGVFKEICDKAIKECGKPTERKNSSPSPKGGVVSQIKKFLKSLGNKAKKGVKGVRRALSFGYSE